MHVHRTFITRSSHTLHGWCTYVRVRVELLKEHNHTRAQEECKKGARRCMCIRVRLLLQHDHPPLHVMPLHANAIGHAHWLVPRRRHSPVLASFFVLGGVDVHEPFPFVCGKRPVGGPDPIPDILCDRGEGGKRGVPRRSRVLMRRVCAKGEGG